MSKIRLFAGALALTLLTIHLVFPITEASASMEDTASAVSEEQSEIESITEEESIQETESFLEELLPDEPLIQDETAAEEELPKELPIEALAPSAAEVIDISAPASGAGYTYTGGTLTFTADSTGKEYILRQSGTAAVLRVRIEPDVDTSLTLDDVNISGRVQIETGARLLLLLKGDNSVGNSVLVLTDAHITIDSASGSGSTSGTLNAASGVFGYAAIGGVGRVTINGGTINAQIVSGNTAAGLGGNLGRAGYVTINGGAVNVNSAGSGACIGSGFGMGGGEININGGAVAVTATGRGPGIGPGNAALTNVPVNIQGGTVTAKGGDGGAGIGGGNIGNAKAVLNVGSAAVIKAYSSGTRNSKPALDITGANLGDGYYINAKLDTAPSEAQETTLSVYAGGDMSGISNMLALPAGYRHFAYTTNSTAAQNDYIDTEDGRQVVRVADENREIYSVNDSSVLPVKLMAPPAICSVTVSKMVDGSFANKSKVFDFTMYFANISGVPLAAGTAFNYIGGIIPGSGAEAPANGTLALDAQGKAGFSLLHGQRITISGLPISSMIRIVETANEDYATQYKDSIEANPVYSNDTGSKLIFTLTRAFAFTNTRVFIVPTGVTDGTGGEWDAILAILPALIMGGVTWKAAWRKLRKELER